MNALRLTTCLTALAGVAALGVMLHSHRALAQPALLGTASNFSMSEYYDAPNETQMKSLISGREAKPQPGGLYLIKGLRIETYNEKGQRETIVESPECIYDGAKRVASSAGELRVQSSEGRFVIEGVGFLWRQDTSRLFISNHVHTVVQNAKSKTKRL